MILGDVCTRACAYCAVAHGKPATLDIDEPRRVAEAVETMALSYVVVTSVDRDDLPDGGAGDLRGDDPRDQARALPDCRVEVLIPDFKGEATPLQHGARRAARRPQPQHRNRAAALSRWRARAASTRARSSCSIARAAIAPDIPTKTGLMVGLGEEHDELVAGVPATCARSASRS